jgi:glycosyltransferase involved in cell wall biosynthesis
MDIKILVMTQTYPSEENKYAMNFVHTRNCTYVGNGLDVEVLSFNAKESYEFQGIGVFTEKDIVKRIRMGEKFALIVSHAANVRNHLRFLIQYISKWSRLVLIFHGHEILLKHKYYPHPYSFDRISRSKQLVERLYDQFKVKFFKNFLEKMTKSETRVIKLVFVSKWLRTAGMNCVGMDEKVISPISSIIPNGIYSVFEGYSHRMSSNIQGDFITIRPFDESKYAMDVVYALARDNPAYRFVVFGRGHFFENYPSLDNLIVNNKYLSPEEIIEMLPSFRCALMPTRLDAQGVMACELASTGMPLITSDIDCLGEIFDGFSNVRFINNEKTLFGMNIGPLLEELLVQGPFSINSTYFNSGTAEQEVQLFRSLL